MRTLNANVCINLTMTSLTMLSVNVRGLGSQHKRTDVMNYLNTLNQDIIFVQDTHLTEQKITSFNSLWKGKTYHSCFANNSRGTSVLISKNIQHEVIDEFTNANGNYKVVLCKIGTDTYLIGSVYGLNRDEPQFYEKLEKILEDTEYDHVVLGGDFNFIIDTQADCFGYTNENNVNAKRQFMSICNKHNLIDVWRKHNPIKQQFTWYTPNLKKRF